jgi:hypothetical protein
MDLLKHLLFYVVMIALIWGAVVLSKRYLSRVQVQPDFNEIAVPDADHYPSYRLKPFEVHGIEPGSAVSYYLPDGSHGSGYSFGWIWAVPGDTVAVADGAILVNGKPLKDFHNLNHCDCPAFPVPVDHCLVLTSVHQTDFLAHGLMPLAAIKGEVVGFP